MNIVFAIIPEKGHVNPYVGPAQALAASGIGLRLSPPATFRPRLTLPVYLSLRI